MYTKDGPAVQSRCGFRLKPDRREYYHEPHREFMQDKRRRNRIFNEFERFCDENGIENILESHEAMRVKKKASKGRKGERWKVVYTYYDAHETAWFDTKKAAADLLEELRLFAHDTGQTMTGRLVSSKGTTVVEGRKGGEVQR